MVKKLHKKILKKRAKRALPLLINRANIKKTIYYGCLANKLGMNYCFGALHSKYVLDYIGEFIQCLNKKSKKDIPYINCLVVSKKDGLPGDGFYGFLIDYEPTKEERKNIIEKEQKKIYQFKNWRTVEKKFNDYIKN